ncbi:MAG: microcin C ABC transporter permease YejB [Pseudomonadota bacterium]
MAHYILQRLLLIVPTLLGIMIINFAIVQFAPGGPIEQIVAQMRVGDVSSTGRVSGGEAGGGAAGGISESGGYAGAEGLPPELIAQLEKQFGFDKPAHERFLKMLGDYVRFDFGTSYFQGRPVLDLILQALPVSISLGLWSLLFVYTLSIPMGIAKAVRDGTRFDAWTSAVIFTAYAIPGFLFAILLIVLFAGGSYWEIFPMRGLVSENWSDLPWYEKVTDYLWHLALPLTALTLGGFATLTMLTKNSFMEEINKQFVLTARAKGLRENQIMYGHVFRNAMLIVIAGFPGAFIGILFTGALLIEVIFSLDGMGLLGFDAIIKRDYPIIFGTVFIFTLVGLVTQLIGDICYVLVDPRIDFGSHET